MGWSSARPTSSRRSRRGGASLDRRRDLYSLGALAYFLLAGRPPFSGQSVLDALLAHLHQPPAPLTGQPADLEAVVLRCLAKAPEDRFDAAEAVERALAACGSAGAWAEEDAAAWWRAAVTGAGQTGAGA